MRVLRKLCYQYCQQISLLAEYHLRKRSRNDTTGLVILVSQYLSMSLFRDYLFQYYTYFLSYPYGADGSIGVFLCRFCLIIG